MPDYSFTRPNGQTYRPRTAGLRARAWENHGHHDEERAGVIVFGTLDPDAARDLGQSACAGWYGDADSFALADPTPGWWRDGFSHDGRTWIEDPERGAPGVMFTWAESDTGSSSSAAEEALEELRLASAVDWPGPAVVRGQPIGWVAGYEGDTDSATNPRSSGGGS